MMPKNPQFQLAEWDFCCEEPRGTNNILPFTKLVNPLGVDCTEQIVPHEMPRSRRAKGIAYEANREGGAEGVTFGDRRGLFT